MKKFKLSEYIRKVCTKERMMWMYLLVSFSVISLVFGLCYPKPLDNLFESAGTNRVTYGGVIFSRGTLATTVSDTQQTTSTGTSAATSTTTAQESVTTSTTAAFVQSSESTDVVLYGEKLDINDATMEQLMTVKGIGETYAQRIISYRAEIGGLYTMEQLLDVKGIGEKRLESIKEYFEVK